MTSGAEAAGAAERERRWVLADGGIETALDERLGQVLPEFAAFVLLGSAEGREALRAYYRPFVELALERGLPLVLDTPTWRANPDWAAKLGAEGEALARANREAVALVRAVLDEPGAPAELRGRWLVNGCVGPREDDYAAGARMSPEEAERYHAPQIRALAEAGADRVTSVTTLDAAEGIGVVRAAQRCGVPAAVSFTVDAGGLLADGSTLAEAIAAVDAATDGGALGFLINCAHPAEAAGALRRCAGAGELSRLLGFRLNAARHGEDGPGDVPEAFAEGELALRELAPRATLFGGCCGTDVPHIAALAAGLAAS
ncbi:homocysteine S-methyltransferase family protein [Leucobacter massiliensis]|uniref:Homocysteine methyltransferase n=1 Tax=Leucobacter massiliensis TaxID=1686285 RepID=A0A2S9QPR0_9MICO|nr:homocysteine S-methyltransferase family protein [Leucobacter massiliensis]PRI11574.1 homocysteine methyltransferase [Leucobacter massiliensis]